LTKEKPRETNLWEFDPAMFQPLRKAGFFERRILGHGQTLVKHTLFAVFFAYPIVLVTLGVAFGGLVFWGSFAGSMILIWAVLRKTGYARNFDSWDIGYKKFAGLSVAFLMMFAFVYSVGYTPLRLWTVPIMAGLLVIILFVGVPRMANR
jgi:hypothetical protein